jgi:hypothetical protein
MTIVNSLSLLPTPAVPSFTARRGGARRWRPLALPTHCCPCGVGGCCAVSRAEATAVRTQGEYPPGSRSSPPDFAAAPAASMPPCPAAAASGRPFRPPVTETAAAGHGEGAGGPAARPRSPRPVAGATRPPALMNCRISPGPKAGRIPPARPPARGEYPRSGRLPGPEGRACSWSSQAARWSRPHPTRPGVPVAAARPNPAEWRALRAPPPGRAYAAWPPGKAGQRPRSARPVRPNRPARSAAPALPAPNPPIARRMPVVFFSDYTCTHIRARICSQLSGPQRTSKCRSQQHGTRGTRWRHN